MRVFLFLLLTGTALVAAPLTVGVKRIGKPGIPGPLALLHKNASSVVTTTMADGAQHPVVAQTTFGKGRVVAFGHRGYFSPPTLAQHDTEQLFLNALKWASRGRQRILVVGRHKLAPLLNEFAYVIQPQDGVNFEGIDVILWMGRADCFGPEGEKALQSFVRQGGGLVVAGLVWGWKQLNPSLRLAHHYRLNAVLAPMGLIFADGYARDILPVKQVQPSHAGAALKALQLSKQSGPHDISLVMSAYRALPQSERTFRGAVEALVRRAETWPVPTKAKPVTLKQGMERLALLVHHEQERTKSASKVKAAPWSENFPGAVASRERVRATVRVDPTIPRWTSTGLYAAPGETISVKWPRNARTRGYWIRIGAHSDVLWGKKNWTRHPEISRRFRLQEGSRIDVASEHGGLVYIEVPRGQKGEAFDVTFFGAARAPWFVHNQTDLKTWRETIRHYPAPWAEFGNSKIILTVRSEDARKIDDPQALLTFWSEVLDLYADLGQQPLERAPQRMVADRQISVGWLHSGYPIMMQLVHSAQVIDLPLLQSSDLSKSPGWGFWHELGHNHQRPAWTFRGTTEVTCNLFSLYVGHKVRGIPPEKNSWPLNARARALLYLKQPDFKRWQSDPGIALWTYIFLQREFGWEAFQDVFRAYAHTPKEELPKTEQQKRDQWATRFSTRVGRDLGPYFEAWGVPISKAARAEMASEKAWMPDLVAKARGR